ncbi:MAG TPA: 50S ribosomal protein L25/general stress protein Ctc [Paludibacter sp.]|jgi:large subunit ribosomal protein L25|nr:50S ribosomal protein L25/general stress protein Ctc [Paludibacter sp.]MBV5284253.1 50S ribosomal protein L25/general stress protein Ctc [Paludibacter sp.]HZK68728.1 50S ribosomal protein L25/general stress protein Ctc [Paludibacter sp.]
MKTFELNGTARTGLGKKATKADRVSENVPCVLYGVADNVHFTATKSDLRKLIYTPEVFIVDLTIDGNKSKAIMKALQFHPVTDNVLHIDFYQVTETKPVVVEIPVKLEGLAEGVKAGGKLALEMRKLKVKGLYTQLPENIVIDVTELGLGKSIQVAKVSVDKLEILNAKNAVVCQVKLTRAARGAAAAAGK